MRTRWPACAPRWAPARRSIAGPSRTGPWRRGCARRAPSSSATPTSPPGWPIRWNPERTPGGSSGGAAAAVAAGMTPLEVGSDLAGSIRVPACFCGIYGLKTTEHRVPLTGFFRQPEGVPRSVRIMSCLGPMARDLGDLELALDVIAGPDGSDGDVPPVPLVSPPRRALRDLH